MASLEVQRLGKTFLAHIALLYPTTPQSPKTHLFNFPVDLAEDELPEQPLPALPDLRCAGSVGGTENKTQEPPVAEPAAPPGCSPASAPSVFSLFPNPAGKMLQHSPCLQKFFN